MSDKGKQKQDKTSKDSLEEVNPPPRHMSAERHLAALEQAIEEHGFKSADEINKFLEDMRASGGSLELVPKTPLDKAQEMIYEAWETPSRRQRVKLARKATKNLPSLC
jgi:hypothetical protein